MTAADDLISSPAWQQLQAHRAAQTATLASLYDADPARAQRYTIDAAGLMLDYSRHPVTDDTLRLLQQLATQEDVMGRRAALFAGNPINNTENRAVTHWQWRMATPPAPIADTMRRMQDVAEQIRSHNWLGATGRPIRQIVNIGIGGSDLGPRLLVDALLPLAAQPVQVSFASNVDPADLARVLQHVDPAETLFIIASKTMTTLETRLNAESAVAWLQTMLGDTANLGQHMLAVTSHPERAAVFGVRAENCFDFDASVGGRYSVWGPPGLAALIALGPQAIAELRAGAAAMDAHFQSAPLAKNAPALLALLSVWQVNFHDAHALAVLPYATRLGKLPAYLQQLSMESNGKSVTQDGEPVTYATSPVLFGESGTIGQHSFHQLLHQGTASIPADFIIVRQPELPTDLPRHQWLVASALAQSAALLYGHDDSDSHRRHPGNRPSMLLWMERLTPYALGVLLALYEHKTFVEGVLWRINSFDQFGVELGKTIAADVHAALTGASTKLDPATTAAVASLAR